MMNHLTWFAVLVPVRHQAAETVAQAIIERIIGIFGARETLHSNQGPEFENRVICQLQQLLGYNNTRTTPYRLRVIQCQNAYNPPCTACWQCIARSTEANGHLSYRSYI